MAQKLALSKRKHKIPLKTAKQYIKDFRAKYPVDNKEGLPYSESFNKQSIVDLLNQPGCVGLRIFGGLKKIAGKEEIVFVLMGIDSHYNTIVADVQSASLKAADDGDTSGNPGALDDALRHPPENDGSDVLLNG